MSLEAETLAKKESSFKAFLILRN